MTLKGSVSGRGSGAPAHSLRRVGIQRIRLCQWLYVDKTRFLRRLEQEHYAFLIRPRRFGKSLWVSLLENYYDRWWGHEFDATFAGTDIGRDPTEERHRYVVLRFDFSMVNDKLETLEREFETYCLIELRGALERYPDLFPEAALQRILSPPSIATKLAELFRYASSHDIPLYVLIDEYDNFANTVLAHHGAEAYEDFTHGGASTVTSSPPSRAARRAAAAASTAGTSPRVVPAVFIGYSADDPEVFVWS